MLIGIGHTRVTHGFLLRGDSAFVCTHCALPFTVLHPLLECLHYDEYCRTFRL
jgi:hypothetical protein